MSQLWVLSQTQSCFQDLHVSTQIWVNKEMNIILKVQKCTYFRKQWSVLTVVGLVLTVGKWMLPQGCAATSPIQLLRHAFPMTSWQISSVCLLFGTKFQRIPSLWPAVSEKGFLKLPLEEPTDSLPPQGPVLFSCLDFFVLALCSLVGSQGNPLLHLVNWDMFPISFTSQS